MTEPKLEHMHHCINGNWYWICPICGEWLSPHEAGKGKGHLVLQSKCVATKHLVSHNERYVPKGKSVQEIIDKNKYFCNKCGRHVMSKHIYEQTFKYLIDWKPEHKFMCIYCSDYKDWNLGLKRRDEVHKGKK